MVFSETERREFVARVTRGLAGDNLCYASPTARKPQPCASKQPQAQRVYISVCLCSF